MRAIRTIRRGDDMPLFGIVMRVKSGLYEVVIKFVKSRRTLHVEQVAAPDVAAVKHFFAREYPTLTWGKPKPPKPPKVKRERTRPTKRATKKVLRKRKKPATHKATGEFSPVNPRGKS